MTANAQAAVLQNQSDAYAVWLQNLEQEALVQGISPDTVQSALGTAMLDERVLVLDQKQPELTIRFDSYSRSVVSPARVKEGRKLLHENARLLRSISQRYGVSPQLIVALWGVESSFGRQTGSFNLVDSLTTLAYEGRRASFFRGELFNALRILDQEHMPATALRGSWAGAMGQCQFMPSTYLRYAVDYEGKGRRDVWRNRADVFASIANYIAAEGWKSNMTWGREVRLKKQMDPARSGLDTKLSLAEWNRLGVRTLKGRALPNRPLDASLIQPDGAEGRSFLVYDNFRALMRWNHSTYFATSVGLLADRMK